MKKRQYKVVREFGPFKAGATVTFFNNTIGNPEKPYGLMNLEAGTVEELTITEVNGKVISGQLQPLFEEVKVEKVIA